MYLCKNLLASRTVVGVALGHFRSVAFQDLVLCKGTLLELKAIGHELGHVHEQNIFACVTTIKTLPTSCFTSARGGSPCDTVILLSDSGNLSIVAFDVDIYRFVVLSFVDTKVAGFPSVDEHLQFCVSPDAAAVCLARSKDQMANFWIDQNDFKFLKDPVHHYKKLPTEGDETWGKIHSICYLASNKSTGDQHIAVLVQRSIACSCKLEVLKCCRSGGIVSLFRLNFPYNSRWGQTLGPPRCLEPVPGHKGGLVVFGTKGFAVLDCSVIHAMGPCEEVNSAVDMEMCTGYDDSIGKIVLLVLRPLPEMPSPAKAGSLELSKPPERHISLRPTKSSTSALPSASIPILDGNALDALLSGSGSTLTSCGREWTILDVAWAKSASGDGIMPVNEYCMYIVTGEAIHQMTIKVVCMGSQLMWEFGFEEFVHEHTGELSCMAVLPVGDLVLYSSEGDGCILKPIESEMIALPGRSFPKVFSHHQVIQNHGPLWDFVVLDDMTSATGKMICAATGTGENGCLRKIKTGHSVSVNHSECASELEFKGAGRLWAVREFAGDSVDQLLVVSFTMATRALATGPVFEDVTDVLGLMADSTTLACGRICDGFLVQVTPTCVALCNMDTLSLGSKRACDGANSARKREGSRDYGLDRSMRTRLPEVNVRQWVQKGKRDMSKHKDTDEEDNRSASNVPRNRSPESSWMTPRVAGDEANSDKPSKITVAAVVEDLVCIFCDDAQELNVLGIDGVEDPDQGGPGRKRARTQVKLQVWGSIVLDHEVPSCLQVMPGSAPSSWLCIMGSYEPSIKVFAIPGHKQSPVPYCALSEGSICSHMASLHSELDFSTIKHEELGSDLFIPENIASCRGPIDPDKNCMRFMVGFRNGTLAEYTITGGGGAPTLECNSLVRIGACPLWLSKIDDNRVLCMSDRTFLTKYMESSGAMVNFPLSLPSDIVAGTVLMSNDTLWHTAKADTLVPNSKLFPRSPKLGVNCVPVLACVNKSGEFLLIPICEMVERFPLHASPLSVTHIPGTEKVLAVCSSPCPPGSSEAESSHLQLVDMGSNEEDAQYRLPAGCAAIGLCLWPPSQLNAGLASSDGGNPSGFGSPIHSDVTMVESEEAVAAVGSHPRLADESLEGPAAAGTSSSGIHSCLSAVKGMAAVLTCCGSFIRPPSSISSTPRHAPPSQLGPTEEGVLDSFYITVGTRFTNGFIDFYAHGGDLLLIQASLHVTQSPFSSREHPCHKWQFEMVARRSLPDAARAVAELDENLLVASVGKRLVCFGLLPSGISKKKWEKRGWILTHDQVTHLSTCPKTMRIAAGDGFNSVVLYQYCEETREFQVLFSDRYSRMNCGVHLFGGTNQVLATDADGCFSILTPAPDSHSPEKALEALGHFHVKENVSKMVVLLWEAQDTVSSSVLLSTRTGRLHILAEMPDDLAPILQAIENVLLSHPATQPLTGDKHLAPSKGGVQSLDDRCRRKGVVDGDLLGELLHLPPSKLKDVIQSFVCSSEVKDALSKLGGIKHGWEGDAGNVARVVLHIVKNLGSFLV